MKTHIFVLTIAYSLVAAGFSASAAMVEYSFTGTISEVSELTTPPNALTHSGIVPGGKIVGLIRFDNEADYEPGGPLPVADYVEPGINMSTAVYVLGSSINFNSGPHSQDLFRVVTNDFMENIDAFHIFRNIPSGLATGLLGSTGVPILTKSLTVSLWDMPSVTGHTAYLPNFSVDYSTLPPGSKSSFEIRGDDGVGTGGYTIRGTINSFMPVPEPSALALAGVGAIALLLTHGLRRRLRPEDPPNA